LIGRTVSHYRILSPLGSGGMGVVYLAEDARLGRQVALKFLPASWAQETKALERFRVEARAASSLSHPSICAIYDIGQDGDTPFIVMEALKGETLRDRISRGPLKVVDVLDIGIQLADALEAAHTQGIVHRDIKPANIFIGDRNRVKVLDFGLAKLTGAPSSHSSAADTQSPGDGTKGNQITQPGTALGTVSYMSPEQARGEPIDSRTDLF
jgi:serine/threonine protein kinase